MAMPIHTRIQKLRQFPPGRARQAASNVERIAFPLGYHILLPHTRAVTAAARDCLRLRTLRFGERTARGGGEAARVDRVVDVRLAFIYDAARRSAADLPGTPEGQAGERIVQGYFPQGLKPVVSAPYEEELIQVEALVEGLRGPLAADVELLSIERHVAAVEVMLPRYAEALDKRSRVTARDLRAAWLAVHHAVLELAFAVVIFVPDPAHRETIIGAIFEQDDRLAALYARRQRGQVIEAVDLDEAALDEAAFDGDEDPALDDDELPDEALLDEALLDEALLDEALLDEALLDEEVEADGAGAGDGARSDEGAGEGDEAAPADAEGGGEAEGPPSAPPLAPLPRG